MRAISVILAGAFVGLVAGRAVAGPFAMEPGARAQALGGAYTAVADDASAVWHNPAAMAGNESSISVGWQPHVGFGAGGELSRSAQTFLLGAQKSDAEAGIGAFFYSPYRVKYAVADTGARESAWGQVDMSFQTLSVPYGLSFQQGRLKLGVSAELVMASASGSSLSYRNAQGVSGAASVNDSTGLGASGSLGAWWRAAELERWSAQLDFGLTHRLGADGGAHRAAGPEPAGALISGTPASTELGTAFTQSLSPKRQWLMSFDYGRSRWDEGGRYRTLALGAELSERCQVEGLKPMALAYRLGYKRASGQAPMGSVTWPDRRTLALGVGVTFRRVLSIDFALERHSASGGGGFSGTANAFGLSFAWLLD